MHEQAGQKRRLAAITSFLTVGLVGSLSTAAAAAPPTSPFAARDKYIETWRSGDSYVKVRPSDCRVVVRRHYKVENAGGGDRLIKRIATLKAHWLAKAPFTSLIRYNHVPNGNYSAGRVSCHADHPDCMRVRTITPSSSGQWDDRSSADLFLQHEWIDEATRCTPFTLPGSQGFDWTFVDVTGSDKTPIDLDTQNTATFATDNYTGINSGVNQRHAVCRVVDTGATLSGTVQTRSNRSGPRYNPFTQAFMSHSVSGTHQVCAINRGENQYGHRSTSGEDVADRYYYSFEYLTGSNLARWRAVPSSGQAPPKAFQAGTLDGTVAYVCVNVNVEESENADNRQTERSYKRQLGYWYEGLDRCVTPELVRTQPDYVRVNPTFFRVLTRK